MQAPDARQAAHTIESLDYELPVTRVTLAKEAREADVGERRHLWGYSGATLTKVLATILSGIAIGLTAAALQLSVDWSTHHRNRALAALLAAADLQHALLALLGASAAAVLGATLLVHCWAPRAAGGGVALVMAYLNGNAIPRLLSGRVYCVKLLGTAASRFAGLALGIEGPMIHLGASVASIVCHSEHVVYRWLNLHRRGRLGELEQQALAAGLVPEGAEDFLFRNADHRELVSAGAAAGLAAAFGAPIGGVLFALEEATSVWNRKLAWRCFLCASVAVFTMAELHPRTHEGMLSFNGAWPLNNLQWLMQAPPLVLASAAGGLLGSAFNWMKRWARFWRRRHPGLTWRLAESAFVVALTASALIGLPAVFGTCLELPDVWNAEDVVRHSCPEGQYNDLATGLMGSAVWVFRSLLSMGSDAEPINNRLCSLATPCYYTVASLAVLVVTYLILFFLASNTIMPGGLFMPCILIGSAFGALQALLLIEVLPAGWDIQPGIYAVVCATAMLGATFRSAISLVVIVVEGTRGIELLFGVILAVIVSNWVAHHLHPDGLYEAELDGAAAGEECYYLRQEPPHALRSQRAESVMASPVVGLEVLVPVSTAVQVLRGTPHNGFPVLAPSKHGSRSAAVGGGVDGGGSGGAAVGTSEGRLQGMALRSTLLVLLRHGAFCDERGLYLCSLAHQAAGAYEEALAFEMAAAAQASSSGYRRGGAASTLGTAASMVGLLGPATSLGLAGMGFPSLDSTRGAASVTESEVLAAAGEAAADHARAGCVAFLNLGPFMHLAPLTVRPETPAATVHNLFLAMSLRHLCVTDARCRCLGIITRKDLDHAAGAGWWRATEIAPTPRQSPREEDAEPEGASPASWSARSDGLARTLAMPARRLVQAFQQRFSPQPSADVLQGIAGPAAWRAASARPPALKDSERLQAALLAAITAVWGTAAVRLQASLLGTCTVWWALTALGFSIAVFPFLTVIGFRGGLARPFGTAAALLLAFLPFKVTAAPEALPLPAALAPFETGVWVWCPLVANVANLILSHKHWTHGEHEASPLAAVWGAQGVPLRVRLRILVQLAAKCAASQLPNLAVVGGTVAVGILLDVEPCRAIGAVFLFLWLTSLLAQGDWRRVGFGWAALVFGGLLWAAAHAVHTWPAAFGLPPATGQATAAV
ncbi:H(+) Cl(-) exchange transporter 7 [Micractinium conductrix]|uniref:Chloride channel protein n=1 Tax=Micractinium conductrix TaxID=554055 RepID=A0A2P6VAJ7_9CHLO|nr:H(+) Cl(-) exchange transporter 7 [Micractinium conductrix]|eukprot:PSC71122.1 H(+) Cl(-) exchange transporter 7 [Micractinium conductrix]